MNEGGAKESSDQDVPWIVPLEHYLRVPFVWWREIILGPILVAVGGVALLLVIQVLLPRYESSTHVAVIPTSTRVALDETIRTGTPIPGRSRAHESWARQMALVGLVHSGSVARAVSERLRGQMEEDEIAAARLLTQIDAGLVTNDMLTAQGLKNSDLIRITARSDSPEKAVILADVWGEEYTLHVNRLYQQAPESVISGIAAEERRAQEAYNVAQQNLEAFLATSRLSEFERRIEEKTIFLEVLKDLWRKTAESRTAALMAEREAEMAVSEVQGESLRESLKQTLAIERSLFVSRENARALLDQIEASEGLGVASSWLPLLILKTDIYTQTAKLPRTLDLDVSNASAQMNAREQIKDLKALVDGVGRQLEVIRSLIAQQMEDLRNFQFRTVSPQSENGSAAEKLSLPSDMPEIISLEGDIRLLNAQREDVERTFLDLVQNRDRLHSTLQSLQNESVELLLTTASATAQVRLASQAVIPRDPAYPSPILVALLGWILGLLATVCLAFFVNSIGGGPLLGKRNLVWWK